MQIAKYLMQKEFADKCNPPRTTRWVRTWVSRGVISCTKGMQAGIPETELETYREKITQWKITNTKEQPQTKEETKVKVETSLDFSKESLFPHFRVAGAARGRVALTGMKKNFTTTTQNKNADKNAKSKNKAEEAKTKNEVRDAKIKNKSGKTKAGDSVSKKAIARKRGGCKNNGRR